MIAHAEKVYEKIDNQGTAEFSEQSVMGAKKVTVSPNLVHTTPVSTKPSEAQPVSSQPAHVRSIGDASKNRKYIDDRSLYREERARETRAVEIHKQERAAPEHKVKPGKGHL